MWWYERESLRWDVPPAAELCRRLELPAGKLDMVLDTDTYNEVDDQFALAYALRSPERLNVQAVYAAPFLNDRASSPADGMEKSYAEIVRLLGKMDLPAQGRVFEGSRAFLPDGRTPVDSPAARDLVARDGAQRGRSAARRRRDRRDHERRLGDFDGAAHHPQDPHRLAGRAPDRLSHRDGIQPLAGRRRRPRGAGLRRGADAGAVSGRGVAHADHGGGTQKLHRRQKRALRRADRAVRRLRARPFRMGEGALGHGGHRSSHPARLGAGKARAQSAAHRRQPLGADGAVTHPRGVFLPSQPDFPRPVRQARREGGWK